MEWSPEYISYLSNLHKISTAIVGKEWFLVNNTGWFEYVYENINLGILTYYTINKKVNLRWIIDLNVRC